MSKIITALKLQKQNKNRVNVFINNAFAFAVDINTALTLNKGRILSEEDIRQLKNNDHKLQAYHHAIRFLGIRSRSRLEVQLYLENKGYSPELITATINRLLKENYLDDEQFARLWIENRERFRPRGAFALRYELRQKGVPDPAIDAVLADFDEEASAWAAIKDRLPRWRNLEKTAFQKKAGGFLSRRGFNYETTRDTLERAWSWLTSGEER